MPSPEPAPPRDLPPYGSPVHDPAAPRLLSGQPGGGRPALSLLSDEPVLSGENDALGAAAAARQLAALLLASRHSTPFTLAVDGAWGMGKSSLMRLTDRRLRAHRGVTTVWYNAWTASGGDVLEGLMKSVLTGLDPNVLRRGLRRLRGGGPVAGALRTALTATAGLLHAAGPINELWERMSADARTRNEIQGVLRDLVTDWLAAGPADTGGRLLVVFIDDLDRCSEQTVLGVYEALKLYLDVPGLAFVIGCDRAALGPGGLLRDASPAASAFLEKIFQTSYRVPAATDAGIDAYVRACTEAAGIDPYLDDDLLRLLVERSGRNPRRIKRLVNGFVLEATLNPVWQGHDSRTVLRVLLLQNFYADFYRMMTTPRAPAERDTLTEFRAYRALRSFAARQPDGAPAEPQERAAMEAQLDYHDIPYPADTTPAAVLAALERVLPVDFPRLAADRGFTSLLDELVALEGAEALLAELRYVRPARIEVAEPQPEQGNVQGDYYGLRVLWLDDNPEVQRYEVSWLTQKGGAVMLVQDEYRADWAFENVDHHLLISDVKRGDDVNAGFAYVRRLRAEGRFDGPVIFYTSEITPARRDLAAEVGALGLVTDFQEVLALIDQVWPPEPGLSPRPQPTARSGRRARRSDAPPR